MLKVANVLRTALLFMLLPGSLSVLAEEPEAAAAIRAAMTEARPDLGISSVEESPVSGIYAVQFEGGPTVYVTGDGRYFFLGDLFSIGPVGFVNIAEQKRDQLRAELLATVQPADTIIFRPEGETRAVLHVFTDVDCFYCQKLHQEMADYNRYGIEIRYLAYPRAGIGSESYRKIASAWCSKDQQTAMTRLKRRESIPINVCSDNPVAEQFALGGRMGVEGTPALITESGTLLPGYLPAPKLAQALGLAEPR
ncbi:MAG: DsbC family protein [Spongiibacteraceae bacterium]|jgi:thiol:disulfide interchange protein DsbC|nr:DsbC family protein [Spongiibacteraceae bacterium]